MIQHKTFVNRHQWLGHFDVLIARISTEPGIKDSVAEAQWREVTDEERRGGLNMPPTFTISQECAQELMTTFWHAGIRPSGTDHSPNALAATEKHLEDMRRIAFKYIDGVQAASPLYIVGDVTIEGILSREEPHTGGPTSLTGTTGPVL